MLELLLTKDWPAGRDHVLKLLSQDVQAMQPDRVLLVPELISHDMERRLCDWAGNGACQYAEVLSFTRLAKRVQEHVGRGAPECLDEGGRIVAMAAAARQLHSRLKAYASVETKPEFLKQLVEAVDEFKRCCVSAKDLRWASSQCEGVFAQKLEELSLLMEAYDSLCQRGKRDPRDQMNWLLEQLEDCDYAKEHVFYIDGFPDFTRQHMAILEHLILHSERVVVSLNCDSLSTTALSMEKAAATGAQILKLAKNAAIPWKITNVKSPERPLDPIYSGLFQGDISAGDEAKMRLKLYTVDSVYQACAGAAQQVLACVRSGCRYRDVGIVCTDMNAYGNTLGRVMRRCGIPSYQSGNDEVLSNCVMTTILSAMRCALGGYDRKDLMRYLKSVLSPLDMEIGDRLENYCYIWNVSGSQWKNEWELHPRGLGESWNEEDTLLLRRLNEARETLIAPLLELTAGFREAKNMAQQIQSLYHFLDTIGFAPRMQQLSQQLEAQGDLRSAQILNQLWEILLCALEQMHDILGENAWDADSFTRLFVLLLDQYDVGTIPPVLDSVTVGPVSAMRCHQVKHLIILGAEEGKFPGYSGAKGVLSDQERVHLRELNIPLTGGNLEGLQAEFAEIYGVVCGAEETVTIFAPNANPSYVFERLSNHIKEAKSFAPDPVGLIASAMDAAVYLAKAESQQTADELGIIEQYQQICQQKDYEIGQLDASNVQTLYGRQLTLSASQIDVQAKCRLSYFLKYGLKVKERKEITIDAAEFGTFVHDVLEHTCREIKKKGGFHCVTAQEAGDIARLYAGRYSQERFSQIQSKRVEYLFQRNLTELDAIVKELWEELSVSQFAPEAFEVNFGQKDATMPAVEIDGAAMPANVLGAVDRVDVWRDSGNNYFRVVDYKTGAKDFDYCDVYNGLGLQMLLYMFALEKGEDVLGCDPRPVGVQYFPARVTYISTKSKLEGEELNKKRNAELKRKGILLKDEVVLKAMEPNGFSRLSVKLVGKNKDELTGDIMDRDQMAQLREHVFLTLRGLVNDIASGNIAANPYTRGKDFDACSFCPYKKICHSTCVSGRRNYQAMDAEDFWNYVGRDLNHG